MARTKNYRAAGAIDVVLFRRGATIPKPPTSNCFPTHEVTD